MTDLDRLDAPAADRFEDRVTRHAYLEFKRHDERGCHCTKAPLCAPHGASEWAGGEPDICVPHDHPEHDCPAVRERDEVREALDGINWDDIRHGSPVSDYWKGWNDGITKAAGHLRAALQRKDGAS